MDKIVLVLGAGGGGGNNLIRSFRNTSLAKRIIGSNCLPHAIPKSTADITYLLPESSNENYKAELIKVVKSEQVDLVVPNNDREVAVVSRIRNEIPARVFLPDHEDIILCQNKNEFYKALRKNNEDVPNFVQISSADAIEEDITRIGKADRYWVRPVKGAGSTGATWVYNADQARKWISLWVELRGYEYSDFQVSKFLGGRDFNFQSIWCRGVLVSYSMAERKSYFMGANRLSGMSSTPEVAVTVQDSKVIQKVLRVIGAVLQKPNGSINVDIKEDTEGNVFVTEINIGRFPMITTIHDAACDPSPASVYLRAAFDQDLSDVRVGNYRENVMMVRDLDTEPCVVDAGDLYTFRAPSLKAV